MSTCHFDVSQIRIDKHLKSAPVVFVKAVVRRDGTVDARCMKQIAMHATLPALCHTVPHRFTTEKPV
jgi:hypothetical protein